MSDNTFVRKRVAHNLRQPEERTRICRLTKVHIQFSFSFSCSNSMCNSGRRYKPSYTPPPLSLSLAHCLHRLDLLSIGGLLLFLHLYYYTTPNWLSRSTNTQWLPWSCFYLHTNSTEVYLLSQSVRPTYVVAALRPCLSVQRKCSAVGLSSGGIWARFLYSTSRQLCQSLHEGFN